MWNIVCSHESLFFVILSSAALDDNGGTSPSQPTASSHCVHIACSTALGYKSISMKTIDMIPEHDARHYKYTTTLSLLPPPTPDHISERLSSAATGHFCCSSVVGGVAALPLLMCCDTQHTVPVLKGGAETLQAQPESSHRLRSHEGFHTFGHF